VLGINISVIMNLGETIIHSLGYLSMIRFQIMLVDGGGLGTKEEDFGSWS
jgi:hypothetical protein